MLCEYGLRIVGYKVGTPYADTLTCDIGAEVCGPIRAAAGMGGICMGREVDTPHTVATRQPLWCRAKTAVQSSLLLTGSALGDAACCCNA